MAKVFKSKIFLGAICIILAAVLAFVALPSFYSSKSETTNAVKLNQDIPVGTVISGEMLSTVEVGSFGLPGSVVLNKDDAIGKVASENMYVGEYLTNSRLITEEEYQKLVADQTKGLEKGYCLVQAISWMSTNASRTKMTASLFRRCFPPCMSTMS